MSDNFPPEVNAPASRTYEHCREWVRAGHRVTVITGFPNFPRGEVYRGYRNRPLQMEERAGIRLLRVWTYIAPNQGVARRGLDYLSFMLSAVPASALVRGPDVVIGTSPQFFTACAAFLVGLFKTIPFVFELRDLWPESIATVGAMRPGATIRALEKLELFLYRKAAAVVALTWAFKENLVARGIPESKIQVIPNGVDLEFFRPGPKPKDLEESLGARGKKVVSYIGTVGMAHGVDRIVEAAASLRERQDLLFLVLGDGAEWDRVAGMVKNMGLGNVRVLRSVPKERVLDYYRLSDFFLVTLRNRELFRTVIPSKIFEAMAMKLPIICAVDGQCRAIVEQAGCGVFVPPEDVSAMVVAVKRMADSPQTASRLGEKGRDFVSRRFDRKTLARQYLELLEELSQSPNVPKSNGDLGT